MPLTLGTSPLMLSTSTASIGSAHLRLPERIIVSRSPDLMAACGSGDAGFRPTWAAGQVDRGAVRSSKVAAKYLQGSHRKITPYDGRNCPAMPIPDDRLANGVIDSVPPSGPCPAWRPMAAP